MHVESGYTCSTYRTTIPLMGAARKGDDRASRRLSCDCRPQNNETSALSRRNTMSLASHRVITRTFEENTNTRSRKGRYDTEDRIKSETTVSNCETLSSRYQILIRPNDIEREQELSNIEVYFFITILWYNK